MKEHNEGQNLETILFALIYNTCVLKEVMKCVKSLAKINLDGITP